MTTPEEVVSPLPLSVPKFSVTSAPRDCPAKMRTARRKECFILKKNLSSAGPKTTRVSIPHLADESTAFAMLGVCICNAHSSSTRQNPLIFKAFRVLSSLGRVLRALQAYSKKTRKKVRNFESFGAFLLDYALQKLYTVFGQAREVRSPGRGAPSPKPQNGKKKNAEKTFSVSLLRVCICTCASGADYPIVAHCMG